MPKAQTASQILDKAMTESQLENTVMEIAKSLKYMVFHPSKSIQRNAKSGKTYHLTAYKGDKGFPDWVYARNGKVLFVEYKMEGKYPDVDQKRWLAALSPHSRLWRPSALSSGEILETLTNL